MLFRISVEIPQLIIIMRNRYKVTGISIPIGIKAHPIAHGGRDAQHRKLLKYRKCDRLKLY